MSVAGVGNGSQKCEYKIRCPIAIPGTQGQSTTLHELTSPIVEGSGAELPGLLGLRTLEAQRAILDVHKRQLIFPGPGEVEYQLPPGSIVIPLEKAPSGHLCMVIDDYDSLKSQHGGLIGDSGLSLMAKDSGAEKAAELPGATSRHLDR